MSKQFKFLDAYHPIFYEDKTYWIISGGRASGKSTNIAAYFVMRLMGEDYARLVIARYTSRALTNSIYRDIVDLITDWRLTPYLEVKGDEIINKLNGNMLITHSMKLAEGTMSARGKGLARVTHLLIDEATELPSEEEYLKLVDSFRTKGAERKIFLLFNPTAKNHWIFKRFYMPDGNPNPKYTHTHGYIHTTYKDNEHNLDPSKVKEWEQSLFTDPEYYSHHILGKWSELGEGQIFKTWHWDKFEPVEDAEVLYGLDFGFAQDPTALVKVYKKNKKLWVQELIYQTGYTNEDLADRMKALGVPLLAPIFADSADPRSIETLRRLGFRNVQPAQKGPDSIRSGIDKILRYEVFGHPDSKNLIEEYYNYSWRPGTDKPIDDYNHLCDALRYAMTGVRDEGPRYAVLGRSRRNSFDEF
jgi:phage terminase large subunit